jgi:hypothetical protein
MIPRRRNMSLVAEFQPSHHLYKMLRKLVLKAPREIHDVDSAINSITGGVRRKLDTG